ncbi:MAG: SH3 domain-containing protein [Pseudomonadota bacterium]
MKQLVLAGLALCLMNTPSSAKDALGDVTNLPIPRYVSMKAEKGNVRRGPSLTHRIDWIYQHKGMPLRITAEYGHWRRVEDQDGEGGWMHYSLLSGLRTVVVEQDDIMLRTQPDETAIGKVKAAEGAILRLGDCEPDWCYVSSGRHKGWLPKAALWGVSPGEIRD